MLQSKPLPYPVPCAEVPKSPSKLTGMCLCSCQLGTAPLFFSDRVNLSNIYKAGLVFLSVPKYLSNEHSSQDGLVCTICWPPGQKLDQSAGLEDASLPPHPGSPRASPTSPPTEVITGRKWAGILSGQMKPNLFVKLVAISRCLRFLELLQFSYQKNAASRNTNFETFTIGF